MSSFKAINLTKTVEHQSELDPNKGTDKAVIFTLGAIDTRTFSSIFDKQIESKTNKEGEIIIKPNQLTAAYQFVKFGLKGLQNWLDDKDSPIEFKTERVNVFGKSYTLVTDSILEGFPSELITELAEAIIDINNLSESDVKN